MRVVVRRIFGSLSQSGRWQLSGLRSLCMGNDADVDAERRPFRVTLIEGEGSGPTVCTAVRKIFKAAGVQVEWDRHTLHAHWDPYIGRRVLNPDVVQSAFETGLVMYGSSSAGSTDNDDSVGSASLTLHKLLNASVGVRIFTSIDGHQPFGPVRMVNIRDNVSGEYSEIEHTVVPGVVQSIKTVTSMQTEKLAEFAFNYALKNCYSRVTALHKATVMRLTDGAFLRACRKVSTQFPDVEYTEERLDSFCLRVINDPCLYEVLLTPSLYGSLASAACSALAGGMSTVPCVSFGSRVILFGTMDDNSTGCEHYRYGGGPGLDVTDKLVAGRYPVSNPTGLIRSATWMLCHMGMSDEAIRIETALHSTIKQGVRTWDMDGTASCIKFTDAIIHNMLLDC